MLLEFALLMVAAYVIGSIPAAYLVAKRTRGIDLKKFGSRNAGASNLLQATKSKPIASIVIVWDIGKGILMVWLARTLGLSIVQQVLVGLAAIAGHNWSVFLGFSAGRGVLSTIGVALFLMPWGTPIFCGIAAFTLWRMASPLPILLAIAALPLSAWLLTHEEFAVVMGLLAMFLMMVVRRLTAPLPEGVPLSKDVLVNRFLYDRDIKEGQEWINRDTVKKDSPKKPEKGSPRI